MEGSSSHDIHPTDPPERRAIGIPTIRHLLACAIAGGKVSVEGIHRFAEVSLVEAREAWDACRDTGLVGQSGSVEQIAAIALIDELPPLQIASIRAKAARAWMSEGPMHLLVEVERAKALGGLLHLDADTAYWGPIVISMLLIANGLSLVTSPSTEAVMGSVPRERAGVASAVNDISRELGGTLGVAITGSIFISLYTPKILETFGLIPGLLQALPEGVYEQAQDSVGAAYSVVQNSPPAVQGQVMDAVSESFMSGFGTACLVVSVIAFMGAIIAFKFLPARSIPKIDD